jgi:hypothetical protein
LVCPFGQPTENLTDTQFASPSIDSHPSAPAPVRLSSQLGQNVTSFEPQPNVGGLGIGAVGDAPQAGVEGYQSLVSPQSRLCIPELTVDGRGI